jgi:hypothetical protein
VPGESMLDADRRRWRAALCRSKTGAPTQSDAQVVCPVVSKQRATISSVRPLRVRGATSGGGRAFATAEFVVIHPLSGVRSSATYS